MSDDLTRSQLITILDTMPGCVAVHRPEFDASGRIIDAQLVWCNQQYRQVHTSRTPLRKSILESYHEPEEALEFVRRAWSDGAAHQYFSIDDEALLTYPIFEAPITLSIEWIRVDPFIVEVGENLTLLAEIRRQLEFSDLELLDAWRVQEVAESRQRIARDMHDSVIQRLLAAGMGLRKTLDGEQSGPMIERTRVALDNVDNAILELRSIVTSLTSSSPIPSSTRDLDSELLAVLQSMESLLGHLPVYSSIMTCRLDDDVRQTISAVVREALANIAKHARATRSYVRVTCDRSELRVEIFDDGVGIGPDPRRGHGLVNLSNRAVERGGRLAVGDRHDRSGCRVSWVIPCPDPCTES